MEKLVLLGRLYESLVCWRIIAHLRSLFSSNGWFCAIWYQLNNLKNVKNNYGAVLLLVKLQAPTHNFTKSNIPSWVFSSFLNLYKWYQIVQRIVYKNHLFDWECKPIEWFLCNKKIGLFPYSLKTSERLWFSDVFRGYRIETSSMKWINIRCHWCGSFFQINSFLTTASMI